ncbi:hypothetical protein EZV62_010197 [Acer yangbiense]|uniref:FAM192A/Fyv6 N-terminal domain-containing protein n=1 Tax=Acer yangbiense TaxID=1000413 RepID=A0A5C7I0Y5_9ROSI|nr:hypothetical protein EZV62_010197 [Acer yangbiense]
MNFVSEEQLDESKKARGERVEDGPPKALDNDETEFLDNLETSRKEYERQLADEEARPIAPEFPNQNLLSVAQLIEEMDTSLHFEKNCCIILIERFGIEIVQDEMCNNSFPIELGSIEQKSGGRKNPATRPLGMIVKVKPQPKKAKINEVSVEKPSEVKKTDIDAEKSPEPVKTSNIGDTNTNKADDISKIGLVSYSDESEDDD